VHSQNFSNHFTLKSSCGNRGFKPTYYGAAGWILTLGLNSEPLCYSDAWPAGQCISLDAQVVKDNLRTWLIKNGLYNHINITSFNLLCNGDELLFLCSQISLQTCSVPLIQQKCIDLHKNKSYIVCLFYCLSLLQYNLSAHHSFIC
jgi:hypothetical protein